MTRFLRWIRNQRGAVEPGRNLGVPGVRVATASINPGALAAVTAVNVDTGILADAVDLVVPIPAPTLEARLVLQSAFVSGGTVQARFTNQSAAAATGGALTHTFLIYER